MKFYYLTAIPLRVKKLYTYTSNSDLKPGTRVVISFNKALYTGIIWAEQKEIDPEIKYNDIIEVIDPEPLIREDLLELARWMSEYYRCGIGMILQAMLPTAFNVQIQQEITKNEDLELIPQEAKAVQIFDLIPADKGINIKKLQEKGIHQLQYWLEYLEDHNLIKIKRTFDQKIQKKVANFIILEKSETIPDLTDKQRHVYQMLISRKNNIPLAQIAAETSYSILKTLKKKGIIRIEPREVQVEWKLVNYEKKHKKIDLTNEQKSVSDEIEADIHDGKYSPVLLHGVTGSGKTEIYIRVFQKCLEIGKNALMLVPEISLTPQMVERFYSHFGDQIAVLHSHLNERERWEQWRRIRFGQIRIVIGARSAIFAPLEKIGAIVVDEEHENSYKQDKTPRYSARDLALVRGRLHQAVVILGSATPSLQSWYNVGRNKFRLLKLENRPRQIKLPEVKIIDLRERDIHSSLLTDELIEAINIRLEAQEQVILLLNRRGHSSFLQCITCGKLYDCPKCNISMNYHSSSQQLICHYCGNSRRVPRKCEHCGSYKFIYGAPGTQLMEKQLRVVFPTARILRMDSDTAVKRDSYESMFRRMNERQVDILLGTQMIAKGLDFEHVTLVGVLSADISLNIPDFQSAEKTFQLLTQVAGRSGRGSKTGEVLIQTVNPDHYAIRHALKHDYPAFAADELILRQRLFYPPYYRIARILLSCEQLDFLKQELAKKYKLIRNCSDFFPDGSFFLLGPVPAPLEKIKNRYRYHLIIKGRDVEIISKAMDYFETILKFSSRIRISIDVDPLSLM